MTKVRAGFYRCGRFCIHKSGDGWCVYDGPKFMLKFRTLSHASEWARYFA